MCEFKELIEKLKGRFELFSPNVTEEQISRP